jgi:hypothetical protein
MRNPDCRGFRVHRYEQFVPIARACMHYLTLTSIAETQHRVRRFRTHAAHSKGCEEVFQQLLAAGVSEDTLFNAVIDQQVEVAAQGAAYRGVNLELAHGHRRRDAELVLDHLALLREAQVALDGPRRLRLDGHVHGPTPTRQAASAAVEERQLDTELLAQLHLRNSRAHLPSPSTSTAATTQERVINRGGFEKPPPRKQTQGGSKIGS